MRVALRFLLWGNLCGFLGWRGGPLLPFGSRNLRAHAKRDHHQRREKELSPHSGLFTLVILYQSITQLKLENRDYCRVPLAGPEPRRRQSEWRDRVFQEEAERAPRPFAHEPIVPPVAGLGQSRRVGRPVRGALTPRTGPVHPGIYGDHPDRRIKCCRSTTTSKKMPTMATTVTKRFRIKSLER